MKNNKSNRRVKVNKIIKNESVTLSMDQDYIKRKDKITSFFLSSKYVPMTRKEIMGLIDVPKQDKSILKSILDDLKDEGIVIKDANGKYEVVSKENTFICIYEAKNDRYGFAISKENKDLEDMYIPYENSAFAMDKDEILVTIDKSKKYSNYGKKVGRVVKILKRATSKIVGKVYISRNKIFVSTIDGKVPSILINKVKCDSEIENGMIVQASITRYPNRKFGFEGDILKIVSEKDAEDAYVKALFASYSLDEKSNFSKEVLDETKNINDKVLSEELAGRVDKTSDNVFTIDSEDSKDLDDAVCVKKNEDGSFMLSVHIADVSHYVKDGTKLNDEAIKRATSIYIPGTVIPMLPKKLSNGICSLNEGELRLTLSVDMHISKSGEILDHKIYKGYIKSKKKMTYEKVFKCIQKSDKKVLREYNDFLEDIKSMLQLSSLLRKRRFEKGSINFDIPETKVELDENGKLIDIHEYNKNVANDIIEEFMLITNETVAQHFLSFDAPFIYRVHERPDEEKLRQLNSILSMYNKRIKSVKGVTSKTIADIVSNFETEEEKEVISSVTLRTLKIAKYDSECLGHFGLAFKYYCHFTSPIRRYPDLFIHRVISDYLENNYYISQKKYDTYKKQSISYSIISSEMEKEATKIERDFDDLYMAMFMKDKIGQKFEGVVSSVTEFGLFVKLKNTIEGLVHISDMKGYYTFDEKKYTLSNGKNIYKIGDKVKVSLIRADIKTKQIDFHLV